MSGLPVYWAEGCEFAAGLMFRVGRADEPLPLRGITHLLEHLLQRAVYPEDREVDGTVTAQHMIFEWQGERVQVLERLCALCAAIRAPFASRLTDEFRVMDIEGDTRSFAARLLRERFGAAGFGAAGFRQYALGWVGEVQLRAWADAYLTSGNAGIWMTGEPPARLELGLPAGPRVATPATDVIPGMRLPAQRWFDDDGVAVSLTGARSVALFCAVEVAGARAQTRLRYELALTYAVQDRYEPLDSVTAHAYVQADCHEEDAGRVRDELLAVLDGVARDGPTAGELKRAQTDWLEHLAPDVAADRLQHRVHDELLGVPYRSDGELRREVASMTPATVAAALAASLPTLMILAPRRLAAPPGFDDYDERSPDPVAGTTFASSEEGSSVRLILGPEGVSSVGDEDPVTIRFADMCAAFTSDPRSVELISRDGLWLDVDAADWTDGNELLERILKALPPEILVPGTGRD